MYPSPNPQVPLPTMYDLPSEDPEEPGLPDKFHLIQPRLLDDTLPPDDSDRPRFTASDLNLYYDGRNPLWHKRPDWFLVLGIEQERRQTDLRWSYVIWQETIAPFLIVELLSPGTEAEDLGQTLRDVNKPPTKWQVYEQILRVPYYAIFDRYENQFRLYQLVGGRYQALSLTDQRHWFPELNLGLGVWQGEYKGTDGLWLRWYDASGLWLPTADDRAAQAQVQAEQERQRAEQERQRAEQERQRAEEAQAQADQERQRAEEAQAQADQERQRAERLAEQLRALGINPIE